MTDWCTTRRHAAKGNSYAAKGNKYAGKGNTHGWLTVKPVGDTPLMICAISLYSVRFPDLFSEHTSLPICRLSYLCSFFLI